MENILLCSDCFLDQGIKLESLRIGFLNSGQCPNCKSYNGTKLNKKMIKDLAYSFFVKGSFVRTEFGGAPRIQFNEYHFQKSDIELPEWLLNDLKLIENAIELGFFYYGPRLWMIGENESLKTLIEKTERHLIIERIINEYPKCIWPSDELFYRLRVNPKNPANTMEFDSPPTEYLGNGRLDSNQLPVMYCSKEIDNCIHECRVTIEDELYLATLHSNKALNLIDLTKVLVAKDTEFESLDIAMHMLFSAGSHSYGISRDIAQHMYEAGLDGVIYPSFYSHVRSGATPFDTVYGISTRKIDYLKPVAESQITPNLAIFGRPILDNIVSVKCINRVILNKVKYEIRFGPVI